MRTKTLFAAILAAGLMILSGCRQDEDYVLPALTVSTPTLDFTTGVELSLELTATRDWLVRTKPEWVETISPDRGPGSLDPQRVTVIVKPNEGYNRVGEILFTIGLAKSAVTVSQTGAMGEVPKGTGTLEDPYTVLGVLEYIGTLGADVESPQDVFIKGTISSITEEFSTQFGNGSFKIKDSSSDQEFTIYRALYLNNKKWSASDDQIAVGDEVVVCGRVINYKGNTPETQQNKAYVYQHNDKVSTGGGGGNAGTPAGTGTQADPYNVAAAIAAVANLTWTSKDDYQSTDNVYVKGIVASVSEAFSAQFGNASYTIKDADADAVFTVFRALYLGNKKWKEGDTQIKEGDEVIVYGKLMNYHGDTPETVQGEAYLYSLNGTTEGGSGGGNEQGGETTEVKTVTVAEFNAAEPSSTQKYQLTGKVTGTINTTYGNFDLEDATGKVYVYGLTKTDLGYGAKNDQSFASLGIKEGDTVTLIGYRETYKKEGQPDKIEVVNAYYVSHTSGDTPGDTPGDNPTGGAIFSQAFKADGQGSFTIENKKDLPEGLTYIWSYDSKYGMKASGYANNTNFDSESWLISPVIDLSSATKPVLTFRHALNFFSSVDKAKEEATLWAKAEGGEWTQLSGVAYPDSLSWTFVDSGDVDLSAYAGKKVQIAFKYVSTAEKAGTWEVDDFAIAEK